MNKDPGQDPVALSKAAEQEAERLARSLTHDPELGGESLRQDNLIYGG